MEIEGAHIVSAAGLLGGLALGLAARIGRFCMMASIEDAVYGADNSGVRVLTLGAATAIAATTLLIALGGLDADAPRYLRDEWSPLASILGGLIFGYGMAQVGTCGYGTLVRLGGGDLRSLVLAAVIGVTAYAVALGPLAPVTALMFHPGISVAPVPALPELIGTPIGFSPALISFVIAALLAVSALAGGALPRRRVVGAIVVGLSIAGAWAATSYAATVGMDAVSVSSFSFVMPLGGTILSSMTGDPLALPGFGVSAVIGVVLGASIGANLREEIRWEACDDARELRRQIAGAVMMGVGGVLAVGCTVGQGLSALSVLSVSAPITIAAMAAGARLGLFALVERTA
ncbi:MAG: YeeE/YedE family protein [Pseudomonadota bacterium]